jgi:hypothetical protein
MTTTKNASPTSLRSDKSICWQWGKVYGYPKLSGADTTYGISIFTDITMKLDIPA